MIKNDIRKNITKEKILLKIEESFHLTKLGLILSSTLPLPDKRFKSFIEKVEIKIPDGRIKKFNAKFEVEHLNRKGMKKWNIVVILNAAKEDVPLGSELIVSDETYELFRGMNKRIMF